MTLQELLEKNKRIRAEREKKALEKQQKEYKEAEKENTKKKTKNNKKRVFLVNEEVPYQEEIEINDENIIKE